MEKLITPAKEAASMEQDQMKRNAKGQIVKGRSGNPGGRPKVVKAIRELAQAVGLDAFQRVIELTRSEDERVALAACQEVLNRAYGKPEMSHKVDGLGPGRTVVVIEDRRGDGASD